MKNVAGRFPRSSIIWAVLIFLAVIAAPVHAGGSQEDPLAKADRLISQRLYNEAITALTAFIKQNPNRFDDAQKRLQRIVRLREEYNKTAAALIKTIIDEPTNVEKKLLLIRQLEELEAAPNRAAREFISKTKDLALFTYNNAQFRLIMEQGRALIDAGSYHAAARKYTEGFVLYKEEFDQGGFGDLIVSRVESGLRTIDDQVTAFSPMVNRIQSATENFERTFATAVGDAALPAASSSFSAVESVFLEYAAMRNTIAETGRAFENQFLLLQGANKELTDSSFLPFAFRFILGRKTEVLPEGIMGALDTLWTDVANRTQKAATEAADREYARALAARASGDRSAAADAFAATVSYADLAVRTVGLWSAVVGAELTPAVTLYGRSIVNGKAPIALRYRSLGRLAGHAAAAERLALELGALATESRRAPGAFDTGELGVAAAVAAAKSSRTAFMELAGRVAAEIDTSGVYGELVASLRSENLVGSEAERYAADVRDTLAALSQAVFAADNDSAFDQYRMTLADYSRNRQSAAETFDKGAVLLIGAPATEGDPVLKYPNESIPILSEAETGTVRVIGAVDRLLAELAAEAPRIVADARLVALAEEARGLSAAAAALRDQTRSALSDARAAVQAAEAARLEAERRYAEARAALDRANFDVARERLQRAGERFDASLAIQESVALRADRDRRLLALSAEITKTENELVVRDVRRLITEARSLYFAGTFERAEDALIQAQNRWRTTNVADEPEVTYWLTLVRGALSIKTGRVIQPTAPLFPEMSQLLSFARRYFDEGRELLTARKKTEALARFEESKKKIQEVKLVFPLNQEASLLELRIEQLVDPDAFGDSFRRKIADAQAKERTQPQEAYSELQDLAEINPRFPGLRALIEAMEVRLGLRLPPPDRAALARSNELTAAARRIVDANLRGQFPAALEQLNEALRLNPSNEQAVSLKDRIQTDVGGQAAVVLTNASEREYQRAVAELQKGNTIVALAIVEQLLTDPQNRNSPRILELQRRIQSRL